MGKIVYKSSEEVFTKSEIIKQDNFEEVVSSTNGDSGYITLETSSEFTSDSD